MVMSFSATQATELPDNHHQATEPLDNHHHATEPLDNHHQATEQICEISYGHVILSSPVCIQVIAVLKADGDHG